MTDIPTIQHVVAEHYQIPPKDMSSPRRAVCITRPRQIVMYLCYSMKAGSYLQIGVAFNKDHSTVIYAYDTIAAKRIKDSTLDEELRYLREKIEGAARHTNALAWNAYQKICPACKAAISEYQELRNGGVKG